MKILFVIRSTKHFHYHKSIVRALCSRGYKVCVLFDKRFSKEASLNRVEAYKKEIASDFAYGWAISTDSLRKRILTYSRDLLSYTRYLKDKDLAKLEVFKEDWRIHLPIFVRLFLKLPLAKFLVCSAPVVFFLSLMERVFPPDKSAVFDILKRSPDLVISSPVDMRGSSVDLEYLKAASKLKISTALQVLSWDNLTVRGLIHVIPDLFFVWNKYQFQEAIKYHGIPKENIRIVGAPVFDGWFSDLKPSISRVEFCSRYNLNSSAPIITYLGSSRNIVWNETWLVKSLREALDKSSDERLKNAQIIFRPHPGNFKHYKDMDLKKVIVLPKEGALPDEDSSLQLFYDTLYNSTVIIGVNTSGSIDAMIAGKPCVALIVPEYQKSHSDTLHFRQLLDRNILYLIKNVDEFPSVFLDILNGKDIYKENRQRFIKDFVRPLGLDKIAGEAVANEIGKFLNNKLTKL
ncbi:MAG: hypothetical protein Athens071426_318 [Parcubacteria group bacterium Athens0714_26]|nr:MAG: hypothetical protein Athens101426_85 [Parcubacteria group bacterium Athens1014_26]TSD03022.1 MAG: hypothetical protein Athens071426_318 [Parcubacteria group bacterium Athens0714_26]